MKRTAADVMQTSVVMVAPHDSLHNVQRLFYEEGIHGAPVVDDEGRLQGIITSTDILRAAVEADEVAGRPTPFGGDLDFSPAAWSMEPEVFKQRLGDSVVSDFMTPEIVQVPPDATIPEVARTLREQQIHRVLVVDGTRLCGVVSAFDLVALLEE
jgi:CBS domain-containing protein